MGDQSLAIVFRDNGPKKNDSQVLFYKLNKDQLLKVKEYPIEIIRRKYFNLTLTMQSLLDDS